MGRLEKLPHTRISGLQEASSDLRTFRISAVEVQRERENRQWSLLRYGVAIHNSNIIKPLILSTRHQQVVVVFFFSGCGSYPFQSPSYYQWTTLLLATVTGKVVVLFFKFTRCVWWLAG
jgi:hypothetical protein